jgi:hypothetical protein
LWYLSGMGANGEDLLSWLDQANLPALYRRLNATAVRALQHARLASDPDDVEWLVRHADVLAERLTKSGRVTAATATTYASRLRNAGQDFLRASSQSAGGVDPRPLRARLNHALARVPPPVTPKEEVAEVTAMIGRWPSLAAELLPALVRAMDRLGLSAEPRK